MKPAIGNRGIGFTLVELLVVITIIVVLLALLSPAMDKAIYQAELAVCNAQQKAALTGSTVYAMEHKRRYPYRPTRISFYLNTDIMRLVDDRPYLEGYVSLKALVDPLVEQVDLSTRESFWVIGAYYTPWWGVRFPGNTGMLKIGDRFSWEVLDGNGDTTKSSFDVLFSDTESTGEPNGGQYTASHPDDEGLLALTRYQDEPNPGYGTVYEATSNGQYGDGVTASFWQSLGNIGRGLVDLGYGYADGSVQRYTRVEQNYDLRMSNVPHLNDGSYYTARWMQQIPRQ